MLDLVIPYKNNDSGELETCLKLIKNNFPHRNIHVVEYESGSVYKLPPHRDMIVKLKWAIERLYLTEDFYLFNDDFFVLEPTEQTPYYYRGTLNDHISERAVNDWYTKNLVSTRNYIGNLLSYELHVPFKFNKNKLYDLIQELKPETNKACPLIRSTYGNLHEVGGTQIKDVKNIPDFHGKTYLSTTENSFRQEIGNYIKMKTYL